MIIKTNNENWQYDTEENYFFTNTETTAQMWVSPQVFADLLSWHIKYTQGNRNEKANIGSGNTGQSN
jgi:hypothetical protein